MPSSGLFSGFRSFEYRVTCKIVKVSLCGYVPMWDRDGDADELVNVKREKMLVKAP